MLNARSDPGFFFEIAKEFLDLHHSVVGKNIARISALIEQEPAVKKEIKEIRKLYIASEMGTERQNAKCEV